MNQLVCSIEALPETPLEASAAYFAQHHERIINELGAQSLAPGSLVIALPPAGSDHDGWRRALAGDLARKLAPIRGNIIAATKPADKDALLTYLEGAHGATGQYLAAHE